MLIGRLAFWCFGIFAWTSLACDHSRKGVATFFQAQAEEGLGCAAITEGEDFGQEESEKSWKNPQGAVTAPFLQRSGTSSQHTKPTRDDVVLPTVQSSEYGQDMSRPISAKDVVYIGGRSGNLPRRTDQRAVHRRRQRQKRVKHLNLRSLKRFQKRQR